jgi:hypothetical protein
MADYDPRPFIRANTWTFAKSVPSHPHEYLVGTRATDPDAFAELCAWINRTGTRAPFTFGGRTHTYAYATVDEWVYWVSRGAGRALLVNRRRAETA